ncbi:DNA cytosine methyltransferase [Streptomyces sp. NPDC059909]|uniref:DNA cytosine methyltransferase n=1 Tax=Streptomyces sp. NPDC059909 TaxID=3346998 RepID=UPI00365F2068
MNSENEPPYRIIDLFAGCGGFTQGFYEFSKANTENGIHAFAPVAGVEIDPAAALTYFTNFEKWADETTGPEHHFFLGDIADWVGIVESTGLKADVILGGPPCQGFSGLGKGDPDDPRNQLWEEYFKIVRLVEPRIFIIENVDRFNSSTQIDKLKNNFQDIGYTLEEPQVLNAANYGAAQLRKRTIVIGVRGRKHIDYPAPSHSADGEQRSDDGIFDAADIDNRKLRKWVTLGECLRKKEDPIPDNVLSVDLPALNDENTPTVSVSRQVTETGVLDKEFQARLHERIPGPFRSDALHIGRKPTDLSLARYRAIAPGENRRALRNASPAWVRDEPPAFPKGKWVPLSTESWDRHNNGSGDVMGRLEWHKPSVTIRTEFFKPEKGRYLHPVADRPLTHYEASRIQGFPKNFRWCGSKTQIARQIGNAVPVQLARALAERVFEALRGGAGLEQPQA